MLNLLVFLLYVIEQQLEARVCHWALDKGNSGYKHQPLIRGPIMYLRAKF